MNFLDAQTAELVKGLSEAKTWPEQFKVRLEEGLDIGREVREGGEKIEAVERPAKKAIRESVKELGCGHHQTRMLFQGMVDMLTQWHAFKDSLQG
jgi:hypothetical protein